MEVIINNIKSYENIYAKIIQYLRESGFTDEQLYVKYFTNYLKSKITLIEALETDYPIDVRDAFAEVFDSLIAIKAIMYPDDNFGLVLETGYDFPFSRLNEIVIPKHIIELYNKKDIPSSITSLIHTIGDTIAIEAGIEQNIYNSVDIVLIHVLIAYNLFKIDVESTIVNKCQETSMLYENLFPDTKMVKSFKFNFAR